MVLEQLDLLSKTNKVKNFEVNLIVLKINSKNDHKLKYKMNEKNFRIWAGQRVVRKILKN